MEDADTKEAAPQKQPDAEDVYDVVSAGEPADRVPEDKKGTRDEPREGRRRASRSPDDADRRLDHHGRERYRDRGGRRSTFTHTHSVPQKYECTNSEVRPKGASRLF